MTFNEEIFSALSGEATVTALVGTKIFYKYLPDNHLNSEDALLYESNISEALHTIILENYGDTYDLTIKAVSQTPLKTFQIGQAVKNFLKSYSSTNVKSIAFERDVVVYNSDDDTHVLNLNFTIVYEN